MSRSASNIILHLLSKNGPQTSRQLLSHINEFPELKSHHFLKTKILSNMKGQDLIHKKIVRDPELTKNLPKSKPLFLWFLNEQKIDKKAHMKLQPESNSLNNLENVD